jgi:hypothetical protein
MSKRQLVRKFDRLKELKRMAKGKDILSPPEWVAQWAVPLVEYALAELKDQRDAEPGIAELERMFKLEDSRSPGPVPFK